MRRLLPLAIVVLAVAGCGGGSSSGSGSKDKTAASKPKTAEGCEHVDQIERAPQAKLTKPKLKLDPSKTYVATVQTTCGSFTMKLDVKDSPKTTASFVSLVRKGFYDGLTFHRISPGFVIQGGDPKGDGTGGPGYSVVEAPKPSLHYTRGTVAMAKNQTEPSGASGSQFFVVLGEDVTVSQGLTPDYALLGKVATGGRRRPADRHGPERSPDRAAQRARRDPPDHDRDEVA